MTETKFEVIKEGEVEINGTHYDAGHTFEFEEVPEGIQELVKSGDIQEVGEKNEGSDEASEESAEEKTEEESTDGEDKDEEAVEGDDNEEVI